jgi:hypothetical protein
MRPTRQQSKQALPWIVCLPEAILSKMTDQDIKDLALLNCTVSFKTGWKFSDEQLLCFARELLMKASQLERLNHV